MTLPRDVSQLIDEYSGALRVYDNFLILSVTGHDLSKIRETTYHKKLNVPSGLWYATLSPLSPYLDSMQNALILYHENFDLKILPSLPLSPPWQDGGLRIESLNLCSKSTVINIDINFS